jgi:STE24 endopeptidase
MQIGGNPVRRWLQNAALLLAIGLGWAAMGSAQQSPAAVTTPPLNTAAASAPKPYHLPPAKLAQAVALSRARLIIHFGTEAWELAVLWLLLATGTATRLGQWTAARTSRGWLQAGIFSAILAALVFVAVDLPVAAIGHAFSLHYAISVEGWPAWLLDQAKTLGLTVLIEAPLLTLVFQLLHWRWSQRRYWFWFATAAIPITLLGTFLLPSLIEPLFNSFEPLAKSHPALVAELQRVVVRTGTSIPPDRMFLMKASEKSNGLNAYVTGIGASKRIVVWDTTADRMPMDEILFTFGHETGHYVLNHIPKGLTLAAAGMFILFWLVARLAEWLIRIRGSQWRLNSVASLPGLVVLLLALSLLQIVTEPIDSAISRHFEHEADIYGQEAVHGIVPNPQKTAVAAFNHLGEAYLDDPDPNPFLVFWSYDHPSTQSRAIFAEQYDPWAPGRTPRFFPK